MMKENWRPVVGYENIYEVSDQGRVRTMKSGRILRPHIVGGYLGVSLSNSGIAKHKYIHRLVAEAFIENPLGYCEVNHKDENKSNNRVENLEWCSRQYNVNYGTGMDRMVKTKLRKGVYKFGGYGKIDRKERLKLYYWWHREERLAYSEKYKKEHMEQYKEWRKKYYEKNREKILEQGREYRRKNRERILERDREYRKKNKEKILEYTREYRRKKKEKSL